MEYRIHNLKAYARIWDMGKPFPVPNQTLVSGQASIYTFVGLEEQGVPTPNVIIPTRYREAIVEDRFYTDIGTVVCLCEELRESVRHLGIVQKAYVSIAIPDDDKVVIFSVFCLTNNTTYYLPSTAVYPEENLIEVAAAKTAYKRMTK